MNRNKCLMSLLLLAICTLTWHSFHSLTFDCCPVPDVQLPHHSFGISVVSLFVTTSLLPFLLFLSPPQKRTSSHQKWPRKWLFTSRRMSRRGLMRPFQRLAFFLEQLHQQQERRRERATGMWRDPVISECLICVEVKLFLFSSFFFGLLPHLLKGFKNRRGHNDPQQTKKYPDVKWCADVNKKKPGYLQVFLVLFARQRLHTWKKKHWRYIGDGDGDGGGGGKRENGNGSGTGIVESIYSRPPSTASRPCSSWFISWFESPDRQEIVFIKKKFFFFFV